MAAPAVPPLGWANVYSIDPPISVVALLSDTRPNVDQGYGGWDEVVRPWRSPITTFRSAPALHMSLPLLLDRFSERDYKGAGKAVERDIAAVERMATPTGANAEPPRVHVLARGQAVPHQGKTWVIQDVTWGDAEMNAEGNRTRQQFTLGLVQYVEDVQLAGSSAAVRRRLAAAAAKTKRGAESKRVTAKKGKPSATAQTRSVQSAGVTPRDAPVTTFGTGEDLLTIAARELGDANRWIEIAKLNGLRDPRAITEGQVIRLP
jgi:hypothetical protein